MRSASRLLDIQEYRVINVIQKGILICTLYIDRKTYSYDQLQILGMQLQEYLIQQIDRKLDIQVDSKIDKQVDKIDKCDIFRSVALRSDKLELEIKTCIDRQVDRKKDIEVERQTERQIERQINMIALDLLVHVCSIKILYTRQIDIQSGIQADRRVDRWVDRTIDKYDSFRFIGPCLQNLYLINKNYGQSRKGWPVEYAVIDKAFLTLFNRF